jgi:Obg family GTPase CgtA-like protein
LLQSAAGSKAGIKIPKKVFHPQPRVTAPRVHKEGDTFVVTAPELERIDARTGVTSPRLPREFRRQLVRLGITRALERAGVKPGNRVRCGNFEWEWP